MKQIKSNRDILTHRYIEYLDKIKKGKNLTNSEMLKGDALYVDNYHDLIEEIAELSGKNKDILLFFRGQGEDFRNESNETTILPTIYRNIRDFEIKLDTLNFASNLLISQIKKKYDRKPGVLDLKQKKHLQWAILQHYGVYDTPLLDVTQSIRVACSFATQNGSEYSYIYIIGMPYYTNRISTNSEDDIVNIRLLSISPPMALRPHYQEAFAIGSEFIRFDTENINEFDFANRLICKYKIPNNDVFWNKSDKHREYPISLDLLLPKEDSMLAICNEIRKIVLLYHEVLSLRDVVKSTIDTTSDIFHLGYQSSLIRTVETSSATYIKNYYKINDKLEEIQKYIISKSDVDGNSIYDDLKKVKEYFSIMNTTNNRNLLFGSVYANYPYSPDPYKDDIIDYLTKPLYRIKKL